MGVKVRTVGCQVFILLFRIADARVQVQDILDDDRQHNAELFEETFYSGKTEDKKGVAPGGVGQSSDMEAIMRILKNPEAAKQLKSLLSALDT